MKINMFDLTPNQKRILEEMIKNDYYFPRSNQEIKDITVLSGKGLIRHTTVPYRAWALTGRAERKIKTKGVDFV